MWPDHGLGFGFWFWFGFGFVLGGVAGVPRGAEEASRPAAAVDLGVFGQVVAAGEPLGAERTLVGFEAGVRAAVARQFV